MDDFLFLGWSRAASFLPEGDSDSPGDQLGEGGDGLKILRLAALDVGYGATPDELSVVFLAPQMENEGKSIPGFNSHVHSVPDGSHKTLTKLTGKKNFRR